MKLAANTYRPLDGQNYLHIIHPALYNEMRKDIAEDGIDAQTLSSYMLALSGKAHCSDPHDKIYGILGLTKNINIPVNYERTMFDVYQSMVAMVQSIDISVLGANELDSSFNIVYLSSSILRLLKGPFQIAKHANSKVVVGGILTSSIINVGPLFNREKLLDAFQQTKEQLPRCQSEYLESIYFQLHMGPQPWGMNNSQSKLEEEVFSLRSRLLSLIDQEAPKPKSISSQYFEITDYNTPAATEIGASGTRIVNKSCTNTYQRTQFQLHHGKESSRYFVGSRGEVGLVPAETQAGDILCRFLNSYYVAVLHRHPQGQFTLVGRGCICTAKGEWPGITGFTSYLDSKTYKYAGKSKEFQRVGRSNYNDSQHHLEIGESYITIGTDLETLQSLTCVQ